VKAVKTAVFPVAGFGTRFLPATKAMPKVLLPIVDRPLIQYAVDEAVAAGIENLVFVTGRGNSAIEDYFDVSFELEETLKAHGKNDLATELRSLRHAPGQVSYVRQIDPLGLGHAVWCARNIVGDEPFAVLLADELILAETPDLSMMLAVHAEHGGNVLLVDEVADDETDRYGIITPGVASNGAIEVDGIIEKPTLGSAPSNLAAIGRYILDPSVMRTLESTAEGAGGEIQLTDALVTSIGEIPFHAVKTRGRRFDCGSKGGFVDATIHAALGREDLQVDLQTTIDTLASPKRAENQKERAENQQ
jgi:UTP--glucose-1-phosphate uridylyltransferase